MMASEGIAIGNAPLFDDSNYAYWRIRMSIYLKAMSYIRRCMRLLGGTGERNRQDTRKSQVELFH